MKSIPTTNSTSFTFPSWQGDHPIQQEGSGTGEQRIWRFWNHYGASVVRFTLNKKLTYGHPVGSYGNAEGLWELAIIRFTSEDQYDLDYKTPITKDVIGFLTPQQVEILLERIKLLPKKEKDDAPNTTQEEESPRPPG